MNFKRLKLNRNIINQTIVGYLGQEIPPIISDKTGYNILFNELVELIENSYLEIMS